MPHDRSPLYDPIVPPPHHGMKRWEMLAIAVIVLLLAATVVLSQ